VDAKRFDEITVALAGPESSRRSLLRRVGGGGLAALIVGLGLIGTDVGEVEAGGRKRRRHHRRRRRRGGSSGSTSTGTGTGTGGTATGGAGGSATGGAGGTLAPVNGTLPPSIPSTCTMVNGVAVGGDVAIGTACTSGLPESCATGFCTAGTGGLCEKCPSPCTVNGVPQCCGTAFFCLDAAGASATVGACGVCA
jgi:hypothetical protein